MKLSLTVLLTLILALPAGAQRQYQGYFGYDPQGHLVLYDWQGQPMLQGQQLPQIGQPTPQQVQPVQQSAQPKGWKKQIGKLSKVFLAQPLPEGYYMAEPYYPPPLSPPQLSPVGEHIYTDQGMWNIHYRPDGSYYGYGPHNQYIRSHGPR